MSYFGRLRLPGLGSDIELVWHQLYNEPTSALVPPQLLEFLLETRWLFDSCARRELMTLLLARDAVCARAPRSLDGERELLRERIGALIRSGVIVGIELNLFDKPAARTATQDKRTPPPPSKGKMEPDDALSFYEIQLVDELDTPLAGITIAMSTPAGSITKTTNGQGIARVENAPVGMGRASIRSVDELQRRLEGQEQKPRRVRPLPRGDDWHVRTLSKAIESISLPDGARQHLMIITRTDVFGQAIRWGALSLADASGPWSLRPGGDALLKLHANATQREVTVLGGPYDVPEFVPPKCSPPPAEAERWEPPNLYIVQPGDTLSLVARRYLGSADRWREIWALNQPAYAGRSPDLVHPGDRLVMPPEAVPPGSGPGSSAPAEPSAAADAFAPPPWLTVAVDWLHESLLGERFSDVLAFLESLPLEPPAPPIAPPPPLIETLVFEAHLAALTLEGLVDRPFDDTEEG